MPVKEEKELYLIFMELYLSFCLHGRCKCTDVFTILLWMNAETYLCPLCWSETQCVIIWSNFISAGANLYQGWGMFYFIQVILHQSTAWFLKHMSYRHPFMGHLILHTRKERCIVCHWTMHKVRNALTSSICLDHAKLIMQHTKVVHKGGQRLKIKLYCGKTKFFKISPKHNWCLHTPSP